MQFTDTDKKRHIYNGNAGVITGLDARTGQVTARLDAAAGAPGREVTWDVAGFQGFRHGYAGTIYKGQGKTLDHTYLLHTHHWRAAASYVALTRQRESAQVFVAEDTARASINWRGRWAAARCAPRRWHGLRRTSWRRSCGSRPGWRRPRVCRVRLTQSRCRKGRVRQTRCRRPCRRRWLTPTRDSVRDRARAYWDSVAAVATNPIHEQAVHVETTQPATARTNAAQGTAAGWLIAPYAPVRPRRDSLGRSASPGEVAAVVAADQAVQRERDARWNYLQGAYRDPHAAPGGAGRVGQAAGMDERRGPGRARA